MQIGGIVFFVLVVFITILFAEGYQYDPGSRELVKKSVVLFEKIPRGASVIVDGKTEASTFSGELRLASGNHDIEIKKTGASSWKKRVKVPEDAVVRFPEIILLPANGAANFTKIQEPRALWRLQSVSQKGVLLDNLSLHFGKWIPFASPNDFTIIDLTLPHIFQKLTVVTPDSLAGLSARGNLFLSFLDGRKAEENRIVKFADLASAGNKLFTLDADGKAWEFPSKTPEDILQPALFFSLPEKAAEFSIVEEVDDFFLFLFSTKSNGQFLALTDASGAILFQEKGVSAASMDKQELLYAADNRLIRYDFREKKILKQIPFVKPIRWFSRIGKTFHFLFLNESGELTLCDEDAENCSFFAKDVVGMPAVSKEKDVFFVPLRNAFTWFDFSANDQTLPTFLNPLQDLLSGVF